jgi:hypothetical protein
VGPKACLERGGERIEPIFLSSRKLHAHCTVGNEKAARQSALEGMLFIYREFCDKFIRNADKCDVHSGTHTRTAHNLARNLKFV